MKSSGGRSPPSSRALRTRACVSVRLCVIRFTTRGSAAVSFTLCLGFRGSRGARAPRGGAGRRGLGGEGGGPPRGGGGRGTVEGGGAHEGPAERGEHEE